MKFRSLITGAVLLFGAFAIAGCADLQGSIDRAKDFQKRETEHLATLPADSPERKTLTEKLQKLDTVIKELEAEHPAGASDGERALTAVTSATGIPYLTSVALLASWLFREAQARKKVKALDQTVQALDSAFPDGKPEPLKTALINAQDPKSKEVIASIRS